MLQITSKKINIKILISWILSTHIALCLNFEFGEKQISRADIVAVLRVDKKHELVVEKVFKGPASLNFPSNEVAKIAQRFPKGTRFLWVIDTKANPRDILSKSGRILMIYDNDSVILSGKRVKWEPIIRKGK